MKATLEEMEAYLVGRYGQSFVNKMNNHQLEAYYNKLKDKDDA